MLSATEIQHYQTQGFVIPEYRLTDSELREIGDAHARLIAKHPEFHDYCPALLAFDTLFLTVARRPAILDIVEQLIGPDIALWNSSFFAKPARTGTKTPWHQDGRYWPIRPLATCTVWIAVDASTTENGCLRVIPGTHLERQLRTHQLNPATGLSLPLELQADEYDESAARDIVLQPGQISLHDIFLVHGSEPNRSENSRRGLTLRYMPTTSHFDRDLARQLSPDSKPPLAISERTLYLIRGGDRSEGRNDYRLRF